MDYFDIINKVCEAYSVTFNEEKYEKFKLYMKLLLEWNSKFNLTAITEEDEIIRKHFIDSIKIFEYSPLLHSGKVIDVGTGAGFPGIPMGIVNPELKITLLDSLNKRVGFLQEVISALDLKNTVAVHGRAEDYGKDSNYREKYDFAVSRAVAHMSVLSEYCLPFVKISGSLVALKGPGVDEELQEGEKAIKVMGGKLKTIVPVSIEGSELRHNLVVIDKVMSTPAVYPRKAGTASKKPIK